MVYIQHIHKYKVALHLQNINSIKTKSMPMSLMNDWNYTN